MTQNESVPCVQAAECTDCESNMSRTSKGLEMGDGFVAREVTCDDCGGRGTVTITEEGTAFSGKADSGDYPDSDDE